MHNKVKKIGNWDRGVDSFESTIVEEKENVPSKLPIVHGLGVYDTAQMVIAVIIWWTQAIWLELYQKRIRRVRKRIEKKNSRGRKREFREEREGIIS